MSIRGRYRHMEEREKIGSYMESAYYRFQRETRRRWYREEGLSVPLKAAVSRTGYMSTRAPR
jgi:hypothetical protein